MMTMFSYHPAVTTQAETKKSASTEENEPKTKYILPYLVQTTRSTSTQRSGTAYRKYLVHTNRSTSTQGNGAA